MSSQLKANMTEKQILELQIAKLAKKLELLKKINAEEEEKLKQSKQSNPSNLSVEPVPVEPVPVVSVGIFDTEEDFDNTISKITSNARTISKITSKARKISESTVIGKLKRIMKKMDIKRKFNSIASMLNDNNFIIEVEHEVPTKAKESKSDSKPSDSKPKVPTKKAKESKVPKFNDQMSIQQLKKIAKDFDIKGYTTMSRDELEGSIKVPTVTFNAKKLTKWLNSIKDQPVILFGSNGDVGLAIKENNMKNIFFADRCNTKEKNFNEIHQRRLFDGNDDIIEFKNQTVDDMKNVLKQCDTLLFMSRNYEKGMTSFRNNIPKLSEINSELLN